MNEIFEKWKQTVKMSAYLNHLFHNISHLLAAVFLIYYTIATCIFTAGRRNYILLLKTKAFRERVCALDFLLTKIGIFISKTNPLEVDEKITLRCIVYLHFSELLFMDL